MEETARTLGSIVLVAMVLIAMAAGMAVALHYAGQVNDTVWQFGYRKGQIDCAVGDMRYELVTHPDSSRAWQRVDGQDE